jgi:hypothetical protein
VRNTRDGRLPLRNSPASKTSAVVNPFDALSALVADPQTPFRLVLAFHVPAGLISVISGPIAMLSQKRPRRHPRSGQIYYKALSVVAASAAGLALLRWPEDAYLLVLGSMAFGLASLGVLARRVRWRGWTSSHVLGMSLSYIVMQTAFWVDNGPTLPLWSRLPVVVFWVAPTVIGLPLVARALRNSTRVGEDLRATLRALTAPGRS